MYTKYVTFAIHPSYQWRSNKKTKIRCLVNYKTTVNQYVNYKNFGNQYVRRKEYFMYDRCFLYDLFILLIWPFIMGLSAFNFPWFLVILLFFKVKN